MTMKTAIHNWDYKDVEFIEAIYFQFSGDNDFIEKLIEFFSHVDLQRGSTWLFKRYLEQKGTLSEEQVSALLSSLNLMQHWEAQLHILQCLPYLIIPKKESAKLHNVLLATINSEHKFVRAWSYGGLIELGEQYPEFRADDLKIIKKAYKNESGSVCARIRQAIKKRPFWSDILI